MERFSNKLGMMVKNQEGGGWVKWEDVSRNDAEKLYHAQTFLKEKSIEIRNGNDKPILNKMDVAKWLVEFSNFYSSK